MRSLEMEPDRKDDPRRAAIVALDPGDVVEVHQHRAPLGRKVPPRQIEKSLGHACLSSGGGYAFGTFRSVSGDEAIGVAALKAPCRSRCSCGLSPRLVALAV